MAQILDTDHQSNEYFFITSLHEDVFKAGKNSFVVNCTERVRVGEELMVTARDSEGNSLAVTEIETQPGGIEGREFREVYVVNVPASTKVGLGKLEIRGVGIDVGNYTGSIAYFRNNAYPVSDQQKLPLLQAPVGVTAFPEAEIIWTRNILIDTLQKTDSEVRFFDFPSLHVKPQIYNAPMYSTASYQLASGSCSGIAVYPKNNASRNFDSADRAPLYQLYHSSGHKFTSNMEGEMVRIKNPYVKSFIYANYSNNQITFNGVLTTDFIAEIERVVNETTLLINIPFATVSDLVGRINEDSPYTKNNLVDPNGYNISDDATKQTVYVKKNFYVLSIGYADFEIIYKEIPTTLSTVDLTGSGSYIRKSVLELEFGSLRTYCGNLDSYKVYGRSLNAPETQTLLATGRVKGEENIASNNFNNALYDKAGWFYDQTHLSRFWLTTGGATLVHTNEVLMNGAKIGHADNTAMTDFVIFKDDTTGPGRTSTYLSAAFGTSSYWYANSDAFVNSSAQTSASFPAANAITALVPYASSQENLLSGAVYDSNPVKLRKSTLYQFSLRVVASASNSDTAQLAVYFVSGQYRKQIGLIDHTLKSITDEVYTNTFFSDTTKYGTILLVPVRGYWHISELSLKPHHAMDYSVDSFRAKIPFPGFVPNELFEIEAELYDGAGRLAYGAGSYTFNANRMYLPLRKQFFVDPLGIVVTYGVGGGGGDIILDGGGAGG